MPRSNPHNFLRRLEVVLLEAGISREDAERVVAMLRREYGGLRLYVGGRLPERVVVRRFDVNRGRS